MTFIRALCTDRVPFTYEVRDGSIQLLVPGLGYRIPRALDISGEFRDLRKIGQVIAVRCLMEPWVE